MPPKHLLAGLAICSVLAILSGCVSDGPAAAAANLTPPPAEAGEIAEGDAASDGDDAAEVANSAAAQPKPMAPGQSLKLQPVVVQVRAGSAVYRCNGARSMTIDNRRSQVAIIDPDGETHILPASPANQTSRYGEKPYALVLDGDEALYIKPSKPPFTCKR